MSSGVTWEEAFKAGVKAGAEAERARIVEWLLGLAGLAKSYSSVTKAIYRQVALSIERGEHHE